MSNGLQHLKASSMTVPRVNHDTGSGNGTVGIIDKALSKQLSQGKAPSNLVINIGDNRLSDYHSQLHTQKRNKLSLEPRENSRTTKVSEKNAASLDRVLSTHSKGAS